MSTRRRKVVHFHSAVVTLFARPPQLIEQDALESYEKHATVCPTCFSNFRQPPRGTVVFCPVGHERAYLVLRLLYARAGFIYATCRDRRATPVVVEVEPALGLVRHMVHAIEDWRHHLLSTYETAHLTSQPTRFTPPTNEARRWHPPNPRNDYRQMCDEGGNGARTRRRPVHGTDSGHARAVDHAFGQSRHGKRYSHGRGH
ncbi:hypothetical protein BAUCODRAFT_446362 [Baudoinia panamericana UAMH 10762]|uniref:Uncharacterized protein n=1 Tax=Baudoinia panamericana (strain UAMH 10762) TaxID=717646 RepID=M2LS55_BAUPA|nr:uncharacterized protein BAUCODRAFT_446362 [Baudoinia panamericana UAMH 10762]EMC97302.1 hypothetical protein BAUCODRAFT_446362 [Baudoinia panamericana UAMH 10762]